MMIGKKNLPGGLKAGAPRIQIQKTHEVQMQNVCPVLTHDPGQISAGTPVTIGRVRKNFKRDVWQLEKPPHFTRWLRKKAQHALPPALAQLQ